MQNIGFLLFEGVQPLDVIGPWEVLSIWSKVLNKPYHLYLVSEEKGLIDCDSSIKLESHISFQECPKLDYLFVPGGRGRRVEVQNENLITFIKQQSQSTQLVLSICTGAFLLHAVGLLQGKKATTYWQAFPEFEKLTGVELIQKRIVKDGNIWSAGGVSSGIDLALEFIKEIDGVESYKQATLLLEYFPEGNKELFNSSVIDSLPEYSAETLKRYLPAYILQNKSEIS